MEQLKFTANRFKNTSATERRDPVDGQQDDHTIRDTKQLLSKKSSPVQLLDSVHYTLHNYHCNFPQLENNETVVSLKTATDSIAIMTTSSRILVYNYKSFEKKPYAFQIEYTPNDYNMTPLCSIISNPLDFSKPDLVIIDPISGVLQFMESIKLAPSLSLLQNKLEKRITLYNSEFLANAQLFEDNCLLVTTSQKRIIYITFKDQYGELSITFNQIYNNRPLISFMLSKSYSIKEYSTSSRITSLKSIDISPVKESIIVLESTGQVSFIDHLKGSSTFTFGSNSDLNILLSNPNFTYLDFVFVSKNKIGIFLVLDKDTNFLNGVYFDFSDAKSDPIHLFTNIIPFIPKPEVSNNPKLFLLDNENSLLIQNHSRLVVCSVNLQKMPHPWVEVITLNPSLQIYSVNTVVTDVNTISFATDRGLLEFTLKSSGKASDISIYVKDHLLQYLMFSDSLSPVEFSLKETLLPVTRNEVKAVLNTVIEELLDDTCGAVETDLTVDRNLSKRVEIMKKLVVYSSQNYDIEHDEELRVRILNACELLSLANKFYSLIVHRELVDSIANVLKKIKFDGTIDDFFRKNPKDILVLLSHYLKVAKNVGNEVQLKELSSFLSELFVEALIKLDDNIKRDLNGLGLSTVFINSFNLINDVDDVARMIYNLNLTESDMIATYGEILIGLCCFLYYTTNEIVIYMSSHLTSDTSTPQLENFSNLLNSHKNKWVHSFIVLNKQDDIIPLVNKYLDFESLSALLESKREIIQNLYSIREISEIEFTNLSTDIELEFDKYFDQYGYSFAKSLFLHYMRSNKINIMLNCFEKHSDFLDRFLSSDIDYYCFAWIQDIKLQRFGEVSKVMSLYLCRDIVLPAKDKRLQASIGKLSTLCGIDNSDMKRDRLQKYNSCLSLLSLQQYMRSELDHLGLLYGQKIMRLPTVSYLADNDFSFLPDEVQGTFQKLSSSTSLSLFETINFVSLAFFSSKSFSSPGLNATSDKKDSLDWTETTEIESATSLFVGDIYVKLLQFLKTYVPMHTSSNQFIVAASNNSHELQRERTIGIKILLRRLLLRNDRQAKIIASHIETQNTDINFSREDMILSEDELSWIEENGCKACIDYRKENELMKK